MDKRILCSALFVLVFCTSVFADQPFRNHRYDAVNVPANDLGLPLNTRVYQSRENAFTGRRNRGEVLATLTVSPARKMKLRRIKVSLDAEACDVTGLQVRCDGNVLGSVRVKPGRISALMPVTGTLSPLEILICFTPFPIRWTGAT